MTDVIIPNFNGLENLKCVLASLRAQTVKDFGIIIVDNGSADGSVEYAEENIREATVIKNETNLGFSKAVNIGINYSLENNNPDYIILLNNDIEVEKDFIEKGIDTFTKMKDAGFIACKMLNFFKREIIDDTGDFIRRNGGIPMARGHGEKDTGQYDKPEYIFGACAGAAFYKAELFRNAGLFDEDFFAYLEDVDLSFRFQLAGYKCYYNPKIVCYHKRRETTSRFDGWETYYTEKNLVALRLKNYPIGLYIKYSPLFFLARVNRFIKYLGKRYSKGTFGYAMKGYLKGLSEIPKSLGKRRQIQRNRKVKPGYTENIF
ncbi:MAG: glycosyltransferase family 2 protein [Ignavibacteriae bacterium]|nr:glycosyltransferase family 2 protein [Ignavibacteriota bacterium]